MKDNDKMTNRPRTPVTSSNIEALSLTEDRLLVEFKGGSQYEYQKVSSKVFDELVRAASVGRTFNALIKSKPEVYPYRRV
jgi:hypothetical protein